MDLKSERAYKQFSFELRQFRLAHDMSRAGFAAILGISPSTLKKWEDGTSFVRTYKLWEVYDRLQIFADQDKTHGVNFMNLTGVFDELIEALNFANVDKDELETRQIAKKLSRTILKAAQTDFQLSQDRRRIVPVPFTEDLELFRNNRIVDIEQLLQSLVDNIKSTIPHIENANTNSVRLNENLIAYVDEASRDVPNPRILHRKGEIIRRNIGSSDTRSALSDWDTSALDGFVEDHQELMRLYFGEALYRAQEVEKAAINDQIVPEAARLVREAIDGIEAFTREASEQEVSIDVRIPAILVEIGQELNDYEASWQNANSPAQRTDAANRIKNSVKHVGIFVGRFILRVSSICASVTRGAMNAIGSLAALEVLLPGTFKVLYEAIRLSFPSLPSVF